MSYFPNPYGVNPYYPAWGSPYVPVANYPSLDYYIPRQFPPVDIDQLEKSIQRFQELIQQASLLINRLANSKEFARDLMSAAQESNKQRVNQLIRSTGVSIKINTSFTPTGIRIELSNSKFEGDCCQLLIALRW
ncbi:hypothetical protein [Niallia sp. Krafla_26]|uniref:hypothetical protein n=1 Tax=Niallia sp. Krafla_26 TaxID=3064703 RepID=UPI003D1770FC